MATLCIALASCDEQSIDTVGRDDSLLVVNAGKLQTMHSLSFQIAMEEEFSLTGVNDRSDVFHGVPYKISRAAFISDYATIMIHAETVADGSGASNYENLPYVEWPVSGFRSAGPICFELSPKDLEGESDLEWLSENGFTPIGVIIFGQYFLTSEDHNDEIVVSLILRGASCENETENTQAYQELQAQLSVRPTDQI